MKTLMQILLTATIVVLLAHFMTGVKVDSFFTSIIVAVVLGLLNFFVKPILQFLTFPITFVTLGLFLLVINACIILLCTKLVTGFTVDGFWTAMLFSIILSISQSLVYKLTTKSK